MEPIDWSTDIRFAAKAPVASARNGEGWAKHGIHKCRPRRTGCRWPDGVDQQTLRKVADE